MNHMRARPVTIFGLLLIAVLAALLWQPQPNPSQKREDHLDNALLEAATGEVAESLPICKHQRRCLPEAIKCYVVSASRSLW